MKASVILKMLKNDGWYEVAQRGSYRQFKHPSKAGRVIVPGQPSDDLVIGTQISILNQAQLKRIRTAMKYAVIIEKANGNFSAYVSDLPGCVATGHSLPEVEIQIWEAILFHLFGMSEDGIPIPEPTSNVETIELAA